MTDLVPVSRRPQRVQRLGGQRPGGAGPWWRVVRQWLLVAVKIAVPIMLLLCVAIAILYVRLLNGPVSLSFLTQPIARGIAGELPGFKVDIGQTVVALRNHSFEFRLKNIRLSDASGQPVALAPLAAVELSRAAFLRGLVSPSRIVLIEPRMLIFYSPDGGVSLRISGAPEGAGKPPEGKVTKFVANARSTGSTGRTGTLVAGLGEDARIDLTKAIAGISRRARGQGHASSFLDRVGLRNAMLIIDNDGGRTALRVPAAEFRLAHSDVKSVFTGNIAFASKRGLWRVGLRAEESRRTNQVRLTAVVRDLFPESIGEVVPGFAALDRFKFPISGQVDYLLAPDGRVMTGVFDLRLGAGQVEVDWLGRASPSLTSAQLRLVYRHGQRHLDVKPSTLEWANSRITVVGRLEPRDLGGAGTGWAFALRSDGGHLAMSGGGEPARLTQWTARGTLLPKQGIINLDQVAAAAGGGSLVMRGVLYTDQAPGLSLEGRFGPMSARAILAFWPHHLGSGARSWAVKNVHAGKLKGGTFDMRLRTPTSEQRAWGKTQSDYSLALSADFTDVRYSINDRLPAMFASTASLQFTDDTFSLHMPRSAFILGDDRSLLIDDVKIGVKGAFNPVVDAVARFKVAGKVREGLDIARRLDVLDPQLVTKLGARIDGKLRGRFEVTLPLLRPGRLPPPQVNGQVRIVDGRVAKVWGDLDVKGSNVILDISSAGLMVRGEVLLAGVPVKMKWQRQFARVAARPPPLQLRAQLDANDRKTLGLAINHMISGPIDVNIAVETDRSQKQRNEAQVHVDLTNAEIGIESLAWSKPAGQRAALDFDVESETRNGHKLTAIRLNAGRHIAMRGEAQVNSAGRLAAFDISDFALSVVSRLQLKGERRAGNIWRISVRGRSFEGRDFFRSLFSMDGGRSSKVSTAEPDVDLDVRISNVLGYWGEVLRDVRVDISKRAGKTAALSAYGKFESGAYLRAVVTNEKGHRKLNATSNDAGRVFKLVGFYPNVRSGDLEAVIDLDSTKAGARSGTLLVRRFQVLGDTIVGAVLQQRPGRRTRRAAQTQRQVIEFDWMRVPFLVGRGQFIMRDAELRGPVLGVLLCGRADFARRRVHIPGTYIPLQGLSSAIGSIPGIGNLLAGARGEGIVGIKFEVKGSMDRPNVEVNPFSLVTPGIFREIFQVACPDSKLLRGISGSKSKRKAPRFGNSWAPENFQSSN